MNATVAQLVEYDLAKVGVAGSNPVCRSYKISIFGLRFFVYDNLYFLYIQDARILAARFMH